MWGIGWVLSRTAQNYWVKPHTGGGKVTGRFHWVERNAGLRRDGRRTYVDDHGPGLFVEAPADFNIDN